MRLSVVFELLLIFLIIAFAAYGRVVPENKDVWNTGLKNVKEHLKMMGRARQSNPQPAPANRYCACSNLMCNCCRDFSLPVVPIKGPGCASLKYLKGDQMMVTMSFGDKVLRNTTISGKKPKPVCMALPGGISKFCGRVYGISRTGDQFKACLGLELRALDDVEAALRVSCFRFGPQGMKVEPAQPLPASETLQGEDEDDEDDDYDDDDDEDDYGLGSSDDEEEDDDDAADEDSENDVESTGDADYTGLSALSTDFLDSLFGGGGGDEDDTETSAKPTAKPAVTVKSKVTTPQVTGQQVTEKLQLSSVESVTSTSYTVSVVQDPEIVSSSSEAFTESVRPTPTPLDDNPTDRVETVPTTSAHKDKEYDDDDDDDEDEDDGDIVSDIIETAANAVGMSGSDRNTTIASVTTKTADGSAVTTETASAASSTAITSNAPVRKEYDDDDEDDDDDDDDDGYRKFKQMPVAIVPNDRRGRTHRRMRLSSSSADESSIQFMKKV